MKYIRTKYGIIVQIDDDGLFVKQTNNNYLKIIFEQDIIKEKGIDVGWFQRMIKEGMTYEQYLFSNLSGKYYLTQEKYDLLKEVLL